MKLTKRIKIALVALAVSASIAAASIILAQDFTTEDPLISKSYIDEVLLPQITELIEGKIAEIKSAFEQSKPSEEVPVATASSTYEVITMQNGQKLVAKEGSIELILRPGGTATIYSEIEGNGLADLTSGNELLSGAEAPINACLLVPRADGRGIVCTSEVAYVMVRGQYEIK